MERKEGDAKFKQISFISASELKKTPTEFQQHQHKHYGLGGQNIFRDEGNYLQRCQELFPVPCARLGCVSGRVHADVEKNKLRTDVQLGGEGSWRGRNEKHG